jgi:DNA segregation ATPase FtsK/SpoIIIE, S-DNA-T family
LPNSRLIDWMAEDGVVGAYNGSNAREVQHTLEEWEAFKQGQHAARAREEFCPCRLS